MHPHTHRTTLYGDNVQLLLFCSEALLVKLTSMPFLCQDQIIPSLSEFPHAHLPSKDPVCIIPGILSQFHVLLQAFILLF